MPIFLLNGRWLPRSTLFPYTTLFRSKDEVDGTVEIAVSGQVSGGRQQHGGVTVVAAGVHPAAVHAGMSEGVVLGHRQRDRKSTRLNSSHTVISYAVFCLKKKKSPGKY